MPALKVCSTSGCPNLVPSGRCAECNKAAELKRGSSYSRGYGTKWYRKRRAFLAIYPFCARRGCFQRATDVNHKDGFGPNGPRGFDDENLEALCHSCHSKHTATYQPGGWNNR